MRTASDEASRRARWELAAGPGFSPRDVPAVALGYFWLASSATGLGTTGFNVPEGNGHTTFDLSQATVASQPTALTEAGGQQFRMRKAADAHPSIITAAGNVAAGWTGNTYCAGWFRLPDASGDVTSTNNLFTHTTSGAGNRRLQWTTVNGSPDKTNMTTSSDGTDGTANQWANVFLGGAWTWAEMLITVGVSVEQYIGLALQTNLVTAVPNAVLFNGTATLVLASRAAAGLANVDTTDWATCYYANGIPSRADRVLLANHRNPTGVLLT